MAPHLQLLAGRFARLADGTSLDLATGQRTWVRVVSVTQDDRVRLESDGEILSRCWHEDLARYVDFGPLDRDDWFEASHLNPCAAGTDGPPSRAGLVTFLRRAGVGASSLVRVPACPQLVVSLLGEPDRPPCVARIGRPGVGIQLLDCPLASRVVGRLDDLDDPGPHVWHVMAPRSSGWRTCWDEVARGARRRGFVPVAAPLLAGAPRTPGTPLPPWLALLSGRALVVAHVSERWSVKTQHQVAALVLLLGASENRPVVVLNVIRTGPAPPGCDRLERLDPAALAHAACCGMRSRRALVGLALAAGGWPGRFVASLGRRRASRSPAASTAVHERPAGSPARSGFAAGSLEQLLARARWFEARGRRASACHLLRRGGGRLRRRGAERDGLGALAELALTCLRADRIEEAARVWADAWRIASRQALVDPVLPAACALAAAWIQDARFDRAGTLLTGVAEAARATGAQAPPRVRALLAECLCWQGRWREAGAVVEGLRAPVPLAARVRAELALDEPAAALGDAVECEALARDASDGGVLAVALCARLRVDATLGDDGHAVLVEEELAGLALEPDGNAADVLLTVIEAHAHRRATIPDRLELAARRLTRRAAPRLVRARARLALALLRGGPTAGLADEVRRAVARTGARALLPGPAGAGWPWPRSGPPSSRRPPMVQDVLAILEACQAEVEPEASLGRVIGLLADRLAAAGASLLMVGDGRLTPICRAGREPSVHVAARASSLPSGVGPEESPHGWQAAWPVRQGESTLAVLAACWRPGANRPPEDAVALGKASASAVASIVAQLRASSGPAAPAGDDATILGTSTAIATVRTAIDRAAAAPFHVLIEGESGAGKELVARAIHARSARRARRFCALNCAALTDDLVEAELFGHARGAFTGAISERVGLFEEADGGTLFLDEVGELSARAQAKLLRAIQEGEIRRLGDTRSRAVDVRIVSATNRALAHDVGEGRFRADLRFRLDVIRIEVPPLRDRPEDLPTLARHFWARAVSRMGSRATLGSDVLGALAQYDWPGNVRELQNVLASVAVAAPRRGAVSLDALPAGIRDCPPPGLTLGEARRQFDAGFVKAALARAGGCRSRAATELGVTRQGLTKLIDRLGIDPG